ncbi:MAG: FAD-dependent oxidoreductase [Propionibacteriaceae bacterium]|jgi:isorenieratene synthase|nr:FAD-dependent oxidoreductase [Propionibacteriaceae bacterium]
MTRRSPNLPGRDRRAVRHAAPAGSYRIAADRHVAVVGGGIAGLAAATVLAERGVRVTLLDSASRLGGRVSAWELDDGRTMSRGFHAFFRQYYNLRALLRRVDPGLERLVPVPDYPLQRPDGLRDSFSNIPRTPPWSILGFVAQSPTFTARSLLGVDVRAALELLRVRFPDTYSAYDGESAAALLDRLRFPADARDLALEVFARSFFADPEEFAAGELIAMFHTYFLGSAEGLVFDVPDDDYDTTYWAPLGDLLAGYGVDVRLSSPVRAIEASDTGARLFLDDGVLKADALVLAADPRAARELAATTASEELVGWRERVARTRNAPPFVVVRLWLDGPVAADRPPFLGTSGYGPLDNVSVLERFEEGAARWSAGRAGASVVELHAYACDPAVADGGAPLDGVVAALEAQLRLVFPETARLGVVGREVLVRDDCTVIGPTGWDERPGVRTPSPALVLAGDWVACDLPVALMERAATTGFLAANALLERWGVQGQEVWSAPMSGLLASPRRRDWTALP